MKVMAIVKASEESEGGQLPTTEELAQMTAFNEELVKAGVLLAGEGLHPSAKGVRVQYDGDTRTVVDGPFTETKELVAGFWILQVRTLDEAVEWLKRAPFGPGGEVEIRPVFSDDDFGDALTPELREKEQRMREQTAATS